MRKFLNTWRKRLRTWAIGPGFVAAVERHGAAADRLDAALREVMER